MEILLGAPVAVEIEVAARASMERYQGVDPIQLVIVMVGEDKASMLYVANKERSAQRLGILTKIIHLEATISFDELSKLITELNSDNKVHAILVQAPLPAHIPFYQITELIDPLKDVDGFHPYNIGLLSMGRGRLQPCTPAGVIRMLEFYKIATNVATLVIGRSNIVGTPMALLLSRSGRDATVTLAHRHTPNLEELVRRAKLIISAVGIPNLILADWVHPDAVIIDVGIVPIIKDDGKKGWVGDAAKDVECFAKSPVPGGVGPVTVAMLMENTVKAALLQQGNL